MQKYSFRTKRLGLRFLQKADLDYLVELNVDPDVRQFFPDGVQNRKQTEERMQDFMSFYEEHGLPCFLMFELETNEFVGRCGFGPIETGEIEVGYLLHKMFWGKGYASEALMFLLEWAKENIQTDYIIAFAPVEHIASARVMQKCGMQHYKNDNAKGVACCFYRIRNIYLVENTMTLFKKLSFEDESKLESFLSRYPETSMFLRSNLRNSGIEYKGDTPYHGEYFAYCNSLGEIQGIIAHYWNGNIMMQCPDLTALKELFHYFESHCNRPMCGILGDERQAKIVIDLLEISSSSFALNAIDGLYQLLLSEIIVPNSVYQLKKARYCPSDILRRWLTDYNIEALGADLSNPSSVESINNAIKEASNRDDLWTLEHDGLPLSLCGFNASLPDIVQIGPVWTPVEYRNQGYARAVVALCLLEAKKNGVKQAILFTNNLAAERAYFSIGFKKIGEYRLAILRDKISK